MGSSFARQRQSADFPNMYVFLLAVFGAELCCEERCWVGIGGTLQGGVEGLYLYFWYMKSSFQADCSSSMLEKFRSRYASPYESSYFK